jgi:ribosomal protein S18 acetylase RimI-like enzyme
MIELQKLKEKERPMQGTLPELVDGFTIREATQADLSPIVRLLADDALGSQRERYEDPLPAGYLRAFEAIDTDPNNELIVIERGQILGTLQLIFIPSISFQGSTRAQIESVRVDQPYRNQGIGRTLCLWAVERARLRGCRLVQLSTNKDRMDAHRFYARLGFIASHEGMKYDLKK